MIDLLLFLFQTMNKRKSLENRQRLASFNEDEERTPTTPTIERPNEPGVTETAEEGAQTPGETDGEKENQGGEQRPEDAEGQEEAKLKAKYPGLKARGGSSFLAQKKLQRGHKFFDSGDYNVVKGKKPGLSGTTSGASKTKPEKAKEVKVPVSSSELGQDIPTADAIISRRMALFRTKSESNADDVIDDVIEFHPAGRNLRSGSMFVSSSNPQIAHVGGVRRGSMFPIGQTGGSDVIPSPEVLNKRRQSMVPAIPSKLTQ